MAARCGAVSDAGSQTIGGVPTTHYRARVDLARASAPAPAAAAGRGRAGAQLFKRLTGSSTIPVDVWIDGSSRVRRIQIEIHLSMTRAPRRDGLDDLFDYGPQPARSPPSGLVTDITGRALADRQTLGRARPAEPAPPAGGVPAASVSRAAHASVQPALAAR